MATLVNVDNFARAETDRMFAALARGGVNHLTHHREPATIEDQPVIRQNRDTLYSSAIVDISQGATLSIPEPGDRYLSVMIVNNDHYINEVLHDAGEHELDGRAVRHGVRPRRRADPGRSRRCCGSRRRPRSCRTS